MQIAVTVDPTQSARPYPPAELLATLYDVGRLVMLSKAMAAEKWTSELGNCHEVVMSRKRNPHQAREAPTGEGVAQSVDRPEDDAARDGASRGGTGAREKIIRS
jgi:hypothetical protein